MSSCSSSSNPSSSSVSFVARYGGQSVLTHDSDLHRYVLTQPSGETWFFQDFDGEPSSSSSSSGTPVLQPLPGQLIGMIDVSGQQIDVITYSPTGRIQTIQRETVVASETTTTQFDYEFGGTGLTNSLTYRRQVDENGWVNVRRVTYEYYDGSNSFGSSGDLMRVRVQEPSGAAWVNIKQSYYRYYKSSDPKGFEHGLRYVVEPDGYEDLLADSLDPTTVSNMVLLQYSKYCFEYDTQRRVSKEFVDRGSLMYSFAYELSLHTDDYNHWSRKTTETRPGGSIQTVYTNFIGQGLLSVLTSGSDQWLTANAHNADGRLVQAALPSAVVSYDPSQADLGITLRSAEGLINLRSYYSTTGSGAAAGYLESTSLKQGSSGTPVLQSELEYNERTGGDATIYPISKQTQFRDDTGADPMETTYAHEWYTDRVQIKQQTVTLPIVTTAQNGPNTATTEKQVLDERGNLTWSMDGLGFITHRVYDPVLGATLQQIDDVDTSLLLGVPSGWSTPSGGGMHLVSDYEINSQGRTTQKLGPAHTIDIGGTATVIRRAEWTVYKEAEHATWTASGYATGTGPAYTYTLINPVNIQQRDARGNVLEQIQVPRGSASGRLQPSDSFSQASFTAWTTSQYTDCCFVSSMRVYHTIPASGEGTSGVNYDQTTYGYDSQKRRNRNVSPGGTITGDQVTQYVHGTTLAGSGIATSHLLSHEIFPDSTGPSDRVTHTYNRQSEKTSLTDQNGNVRQFDRDALGRSAQDRVTKLGTGVDDRVRRIEKGYDARGNVSRFTSFDNATVGSGSVVNEVTFEFNDFNQSIDTGQAHSGAVDPTSSPHVATNYTDGSDNTLRQDSITYPNGRVITRDYGTAGSITDKLNQVSSLIDDDSQVLANYKRLGLRTLIEQTSPQPDLRYTLISPTLTIAPDTGDIYSGLDRFGRVKDVRWRDVSAGTDLSRIQYRYDRASNRTWRENPSDPNREHDWLYAYDELHRLASGKRGQLNAGHTSITTLESAQCWTLDPTGNWKEFRQDESGDGTWDFNQTRTANAVNEITDISNTPSDIWATPAYDKNGNTTTNPRPDLGTNATMTATYDAWNRMTKVVDDATSNTLLENEFDGRNFRIVAKEYASGTLAGTYQYYFTDAWQCVEEHVDTSNTPRRQYVWGLRYIDDLILRDRDISPSGGLLGERLYYLADANWNTTAIVDTSGFVRERYEYDPYGKLSVFEADFTSRTTSNYNVHYTYTNREWTPLAGLYYFRNRWYDPQLGRFSSRDPIGYEGSPWNLYEYVRSLPTRNLDPSGKIISCTGLGGFGGLGLAGTATVLRCSDDCGSPKTYMFCGGVGVGGGASGGAIKGYSKGCLCSGRSFQVSLQGAIGFFGGAIGNDPTQGSGPDSIGVGVGFGAGGSLTFDGCYTF